MTSDLERRRLRFFALIAFAAIGSIGALLAIFWPQGGHPPAIDADDVTAVEIELKATSGAQDPLNRRLEKSEFWRDLAAVLNSGREVTDRTDLDSGYITFQLRDGSTRGFGLFSGPSVEYYYFRDYGGAGYKVYRVPRAALRDAVRKFGVERLDDPNFK
jgi:hypothetical protein